MVFIASSLQSNWPGVLPLSNVPARSVEVPFFAPTMRSISPIALLICNRSLSALLALVLNICAIVFHSIGLIDNWLDCSQPPPWQTSSAFKLGVWWKIRVMSLSAACAETLKNTKLNIKLQNKRFVGNFILLFSLYRFLTRRFSDCATIGKVRMQMCPNLGNAL